MRDTTPLVTLMLSPPMGNLAQAVRVFVFFLGVHSIFFPGFNLLTLMLSPPMGKLAQPGAFNFAGFVLQFS
jgi:hypothetical protein